MIGLVLLSSASLLFVALRLGKTERTVREQFRQAAALADLEARRRRAAERECMPPILAPVLVEPRCAGNASLPGGWF